MMKRFITFVLLLFFSVAILFAISNNNIKTNRISIVDSKKISASKQLQKKSGAVISMSSLLDEMVSFDEASLFPEIPYTTHQVSSYDRRSIAPDQANWFANNDGYGVIRQEIIDGKTIQTLFDEQGPGAITRVWVTSAGNKKGILRFYFDNETTPRLTINQYDFAKFGIEDYGEGLLNKHTSYREGENTRGGSTMYLPIPYAQACKITFEQPTDVNPSQKYYHFNVRKYPAGTNVETFTADLLTTLSPKITETNQKLNNPSLPTGLSTLQAEKNIAAKDEVSLTLPAGQHAVYELEFEVEIKDPSIYTQLMRSLILKGTFDGKETVLVPLGDFSGGGTGAKTVSSWYLTSNGSGKITSRWVMPYQTSGTITVQNISSIPANVKINAKYKTRPWTARSLYFFSNWKSEKGVRLSNLSAETNTPTSPIDWNFATITGRGVYKGDVISLFNHTQSWYGEGDEKLWVDGDTFPSHFGTGLEDYYNSSWAPVVVFQTPFGGAPRADLPSAHGYNTFFRSRNLDGITFNQNFKFDIETLSWANGKVDYATTIYWYGDANSEALGTSGVAEAAEAILPDALAFKIPNGVEMESLTPELSNPNIEVSTQSMTRYEGLWSDGSHRLLKKAVINDEIVFKFKNLGYRVLHDLKFYYTKSNDFPMIDLYIDNVKIGETIDLYNPTVTNDSVSLGRFFTKRYADGDYIHFKIKVKAKNPLSSGYIMGFDCMQFKKYEVKNVIEFENLTPTVGPGTWTNRNQEMGQYAGLWSGSYQKVFTGGTVGNYAIFDILPPDVNKKYNVYIQGTKAGDFAIQKFSINGIDCGTYDMKSTAVTNTGELNLGLHDVIDGKLKFKVEVTGKTSTGYVVGLDYIRLVPIEQTTDLATGIQNGVVSIIDLNNDGNKDVILTGLNSTNTLISKVFNNNQSTFTDIGSIFPALSKASINWNDINNDGFADAIVAGFDSNLQAVTKIYTGNGNGAFTELNTNITASAPGSGFADLNNDGYTDVFVFGNYDNGKAKIYFNNKQGSFTESAQFNSYDFLDSQISVVDYDNDGDLDLFVMAKRITAFNPVQSISFSRIFENNNGVFTEVNIGIDEKSIGSAVWGDINGDGRADLLIAGDDGIVNLYLNNVDRTFTKLATFKTFMQLAVNNGLRLADWNNDGTLDLIITGSNSQSQSQQTAIYLNNGLGGFTAYSGNSSMPGVDKSAIEVADLNNDGKLDLVITGYSNNLFAGPESNYNSAISQIITNTTANNNLAPSVPSNLQATQNGTDLVLSWDKAQDATTPTNAITYNIYLKNSDGKYYYAPLANESTGSLALQKIGNMQYNTTWKVKDLPLGSYTWGVQAIDNSFAASAFASASATVVDVSVLAVNLSSFIVSKDQQQVTLKWNTSSEDDKGYYEISKSTDGKNFSLLQTIAGKNQKNNDYLTFDKNPTMGTNYYQLMYFDNNGEKQLLGTKSVVYILNNDAVVVYPNPTQGDINVYLPTYNHQIVTISITDLSGKTFLKKNTKVIEGKIQLKTTLASGFYLLTISDNNFKHTTKIIVK